MPVLRGKSHFDAIARRWHDLAERRLAYFTDLYRSGRWRRYYATEDLFAAHMLDAIRAAENWARLAGQRTSSPARPLAIQSIASRQNSERPAA